MLIENCPQNRYVILLCRFFVTIFFLASFLSAGNSAEFSSNNIVPAQSSELSTLCFNLDSATSPTPQSQSSHAILPIGTNSKLPDCNTSQNIFDNNKIESRTQQSTWSYQLLPTGRIYQSYLAGVNETRLGLAWNKDSNLGMIWDATVGGNAPLFRYGTHNSIFPEGFQIEVEGSAHLRMDFERERDMDATDYRFSLPITWGNKIWQFRTGYFHVSSHLGDERMIRLINSGQPHKRINYVRESILLGASYRINPSTRIYFEIDYSTWLGELTKPWHFQFGAEYSSPYPIANFSYSPFFAVNIQMLEEQNFDGNLTIQAGLQWRNNEGRLFRIGLQYFYGISEQYEHLYAERENKFGVGIWFDF
jgi:hypothetical protein